MSPSVLNNVIIFVSVHFVTQVRHSAPSRKACEQPYHRSYTSNDHGRGRIEHLPLELPGKSGQNRAQQNKQPGHNGRAAGALGVTYTDWTGCATHRWLVFLGARAPEEEDEGHQRDHHIPAAGRYQVAPA